MQKFVTCRLNQKPADRELAESTKSSAEKFAEMDRLDREGNIDDELAELKSKMQKG